jgi:hypothetical protein
MKQSAIIFILVLCFMNMAQAQRYLPGQKGIQVTAGTVNGFTLDERNPNFAAHAGAAFFTGRRVEYSIAFGGKIVEENEE